MKLSGAISETTERWTDWFERRLSELPGWDDMSERERSFVVAYACTGEKREALRFINRHSTWCYDHRFRSKPFLDLVTDEGGGQDNFIVSSRARMLEEATAWWTLESMLTLGSIIDAKPSRKTGITFATKLRAIQAMLRLAGLLR